MLSQNSINSKNIRTLKSHKKMEVQWLMFLQRSGNRLKIIADKQVSQVKSADDRRRRLQANLDLLIKQK